jgi:hypothetical protein
MTACVLTGIWLMNCAREAPSGEANRSVPRDSVYNVRDFGALGDGKHDDTKAIQRALDQAGRDGGGTVLAPRGVYLIEGHLAVPTAVTLAGIWQSVPAHAGIRDDNQPDPKYGTTLLAVADQGTEDGIPFIHLTTNSTLKGVVIYYPNQIPNDVPQPYPYAIAMRGNNPAVIDVELLNPYNGIDASDNQRHLIRNVHGQPLRRGIFVDEIYDVGRIENVHWNPWWSLSRKLSAFQKKNGEAFIFGKSDWEYVHNTFCFGYRIGYKFIKGKGGTCNGNFLGIGADDCREACVWVDEANWYGLLITNGEFVSYRGDNPTMVVVGPENFGTVRFVNCSFWGQNNQIARIAGTGSIGFSDCYFMNWDKNQENRAAIQAAGGRLIVRGCDFFPFSSPEAPQIQLGPEVTQAVITGNIFQGPQKIINQSKGDVQIGLNSESPLK